MYIFTVYVCRLLSPPFAHAANLRLPPALGPASICWTAVPVELRSMARHFLGLLPYICIRLYINKTYTYMYKYMYKFSILIISRIKLKFLLIFSDLEFSRKFLENFSGKFFAPKNFWKIFKAKISAKFFDGCGRPKNNPDKLSRNFWKIFRIKKRKLLNFL